MKTITKECLTCNKEFEASYYDSIKGMGKFCSKVCHYEHKKAVSFETGARVIKVCLGCGKGFSVNKGELTKGNGKYCSVICSISAHRGAGNVLYKGKVEVKCQECSKKFEVFPSHVERTKF